MKRKIITWGNLLNTTAWRCFWETNFPLLYLSLAQDGDELTFIKYTSLISDIIPIDFFSIMIYALNMNEQYFLYHNTVNFIILSK
jgi:hypothetical protein